MAQFRAKARAVDMLGKGQIADLPTAISELWKNGYDAYGNNFQGFLYMPGYNGSGSPVFVLSDDGKGMNKSDILDKWFVLGTDSKSRNEPDVMGEETLFKKPRIKMGEKGIGRLAVAYLGPQMFMLTKKLHSPLEVVFFDWRILENFNLFLQDISIPNKSIADFSEVTNTFETLKKEFLLNFPENIEKQDDPWKDQLNIKNAIIDDCRNLALPTYLIDEQIKDLFEDTASSHCTRFIIFQPDPQLLELEHISNRTEYSIEKSSLFHSFSAIIALFNLFKDENPEYTTSFWIVNESGRYDLFKARAFFLPEDFKECDHLIDGSFDEYGNFSGVVRIYKKNISHRFSNIRKGNKTYGPFSLKLGYVMGRKDESSLNDEQWVSFSDKLDLYGGLYIYRDGFRVLPYGRADNDFLEFEERRGKGAGDYFFAKRRMFGYIEISRNQNPKLIDKSSREGFVNNIAFRDFKWDLINFFLDLAKKYFATHAEYDYKDQQKEHLKKLSEAEEQEKKRDIESRKLFAKQLKQYPQELDNLEVQYTGLLKKIEVNLNNADLAYDDIQSLLSQLDTCKIQVQNYKVSRPIRYKPTALQEKNLHAFQNQYSDFQKIISNSDQLIKKAQAKLKIQDLFKDFEAKNKLFYNTIANHFSEYADRLNVIQKKLSNELSVEKEKFLAEFNSKYTDIIPSKSDVNDILHSTKLLEGIFTETRERISDRISPFLSHLERVSFDVNEDNLVGYYKVQFEEMKEEWIKTYELAQLGIAVEIIDHQFNTLYAQLSENIKSLQNDLSPTKETTHKYKMLVNAFHHLEDNYKLLQPLYRTSGRVRKDVSAIELYDYARDFFNTKLIENKIDFELSPAAKLWNVFSYESIFKPVIINIVNNAIYWLQPAEKRKIVIDAAGGKLLIMNSGVPIDDTALENIFRLFYSERPSGRGIGLYLAKRSLNGIGFDIRATNDQNFNLLNGACFIIEKNE